MSPVFQNRSKIVPSSKSRNGEKWSIFPENALCRGQQTVDEFARSVAFLFGLLTTGTKRKFLVIFKNLKKTSKIGFFDLRWKKLKNEKESKWTISGNREIQKKGIDLLVIYLDVFLWQKNVDFTLLPASRGQKWVKNESKSVGRNSGFRKWPKKFRLDLWSEGAWARSVLRFSSGGAGKKAIDYVW